jgi:hypothetical protein
VAGVNFECINLDCVNLELTILSALLRGSLIDIHKRQLTGLVDDKCDTYYCLFALHCGLFFFPRNLCTIYL